MRKKILQAVNLDCIAMDAEEDQVAAIRGNDD